MTIFHYLSLQFCGKRVSINIIMIDVNSFPVQELPPGRPLFKKGDLYSQFYFLEEGKANVVISQISIQVSAPMFLGDYQILADIEYRTSSIKTASKCKVRTLPMQYYSHVSKYHESIMAAFEKFCIKAKLLKYWLMKLFSTSLHKRNDEVRCEDGIGVVLQGEFRLSSNIPIVRMKEPNFELLRRFQICSLGEYELFVQNLICETHKGIAGVMTQGYSTQLAANFEEFNTILSVASSKRMMHASMSRQIAKNCKKKRNLFQHMVPITLKDSIKAQPTERCEQGANKSELSRLATSEQVFTVKDNITQFLHKQWRRGLSLKIPKKTRENLKLQTIRKKKIEQFNNPEMISLTIPKEFKEVKFNFKMLLKTKENALMRSRRFKTEPTEQVQRKLLFQD